MGRKVFQVARPQNISKESLFDVYFYRLDGTFLGKAGGQEFYFSDIPIPGEAAYYRAVFNREGTAGVQLGTYAQRKAKDVLVENSEISFNRRQGISVVGADQVHIRNNRIHDIQGTAPESGIDVEGGYFPNSRIRISGNTFDNNKAYDVILFDGREAVVEENRMASRGAVGLSSTPLFQNAVIIGNTFDGSNVLLQHHLVFKGNTMVDGWAKFTGPDVVLKKNRMMDSSLTVESRVPFGITVEELTMSNTKKRDQALIINGNPVRLTDVSVLGPTLLRSISGSAVEGTIFERLKIIDYNGRYGLDLPAGVYNDCVFKASDFGQMGPEANKAGTYEFNRCTFETNGTGLLIANPKAEVLLERSRFEIKAPLDYGNAAIYAQAAKKVVLTDNTIRAEQLKSANVAMIKINNYGAANKQHDVLEAAIKGNKIITNVFVKGISTIDAGIGAPPYEVANNDMTNAGLEIRERDRTR